jgi:hypothetical protein
MGSRDRGTLEETVKRLARDLGSLRLCVLRNFA